MCPFPRCESPNLRGTPRYHLGPPPPGVLCTVQTPGPERGLNPELPHLTGVGWGKTVPMLCRANLSAKLSTCFPSPYPCCVNTAPGLSSCPLWFPSPDLLWGPHHITLSSVHLDENTTSTEVVAGSCGV